MCIKQFMKFEFSLISTKWYHRALRLPWYIVKKKVLACDRRKASGGLNQLMVSQPGPSWYLDPQRKYRYIRNTKTSKDWIPLTKTSKDWIPLTKTSKDWIPLTKTAHYHTNEWQHKNGMVYGRNQDLVNRDGVSVS